MNYIQPIPIISPMSGNYVYPRIKTYESRGKIYEEAYWYCPDSGQFIRKGLVSVTDKEKPEPKKKFKPSPITERKLINEGAPGDQEDLLATLDQIEEWWPQLGVDESIIEFVKSHRTMPTLGDVLAKPMELTQFAKQSKKLIQGDLDKEPELERVFELAGDLLGHEWANWFREFYYDYHQKKAVAQRREAENEPIDFRGNTVGGGVHEPAMGDLSPAQRSRINVPRSSSSDVWKSMSSAANDPDSFA